jgi:hypothetical protein
VRKRINKETFGYGPAGLKKIALANSESDYCSTEENNTTVIVCVGIPVRSAKTTPAMPTMLTALAIIFVECPTGSKKREVVLLFGLVH